MNILCEVTAVIFVVAPETLNLSCQSFKVRKQAIIGATYSQHSSVFPNKFWISSDYLNV